MNAQLVIDRRAYSAAAAEGTAESARGDVNSRRAWRELVVAVQDIGGAIFPAGGTQALVVVEQDRAFLVLVRSQNWTLAITGFSQVGGQPA